MALKVNEYVMPDETIVKNAYVRIKNVLLESIDYERLEPAGDDLRTTWVTNFEGKASVYVYADDKCRLNNVSPIHWFAMDFSFDPSSNIFSQAYGSLKSKYANVEDC